VVDIWKSTHGKKNIVRVFEEVQWVLRIYGHKREQITGERREKLHKKELQSLYPQSYTTEVMK
jgi:hypothetical protein